jgi:hypothetical protein
MIAQIAAWWVPLSIGAAFGLFIMAIIAAGKIDRMKGKHLKEREAHLEIISKQLSELGAMKFLGEFQKRKPAEKPLGPTEQTKDGSEK